MRYVYVDYGDGHGFTPHLSFNDKDDVNKGTTFMTVAQAEVQDLRDSGYKAKYGGPF